MRVLAVATSLSLACLSSPSGTDSDASVTDGAVAADAVQVDASCDDTDGDGYLAAGCGSTAPADCEPTNASIHPGAFEIAGDSVDDDCYQGDLGDDKVGALGVGAVGADIQIVGKTFEAWFDDEEGESLAVLAQNPSDGNLLYAGPMNERLVGSHWWPDFFSWEAVAPGLSSELLSPAVYRRRIAWTGQPTPVLSGIRWYTVWPDGRIHIDQQVNVEPISPGSYMTSYVALDPAQFTNVNTSVDAGGPWSLSTYDYGTHGDNLFIVNESAPTPTGYSCAYHATEELLVGLAWDVETSPASNGARITQGMMEGDATNHAVALQWDWRDPGDGAVASPLTYRGSFLLYIGATGTNPCQPMSVRLAEMTRPAIMVPSTGSVITDSVGDDDGDGYDQGGGFYALQASDGDVEVTVDTQGPSLVAPQTSSFFIAGVGNYIPLVFLNGTRLVNGGDYVYSRVGSDGWLYLDAPLANGDVLSVDSP